MSGASTRPAETRRSSPAPPSATTAPPAPERALRKDIQALRALAVGAVVINHLWPMRLPGGYVGVDIFFVISGFLITAHLLGELDSTGRLSLPRFYARRVRRLLPAALVVAFASLAAVIVWFPPARWERIAQETFAASAYFENWLLAVSSVDYSARNEEASTVQHYWSLSVEEQFYLFWPLVLLGAFWFLAKRSPGGRAPLALVTAALAALSFAFSVWQTEALRSAAYFNTFGRVWEFMLGALVAIAAPAIARSFAGGFLSTMRGPLQLLGYAGLAVAVLTFDTSTAFPGPWAILPAVCTALIIAAGPEVPAWSPARLLHWRAIQYTGAISYSLYLWHWPLILLAPFVLDREPGAIDRLALLVASFVLAAATKRWVEDPGRTRLFRGAKPRRTLLAALISVIVVAALTYGTAAAAQGIQAREASRLADLMASECFGARALDPARGCDAPFAPADLPPAGSHNTPWFSPEECLLAPPERQILAEGEDSLVECDFSAGSAAPLRVWLVGDSHSEHWKSTVYDLARGNGWNVTATMQGGCPTPAVPLESAFGEPVDEEKRQACLEWSEEVSERILADQPDIVLVSNFSSTEWVNDGSGRPQSEQLATAFEISLGAWADAGAEVVVIRDVPTAGAELGPSCVELRGDENAGCTVPQEQVLPEDPMVTAAQLYAHPAVRSVDLTERFCVDGVCSGVIGGLPVYYDDDHLSRSYAATLAAPLGERLSAALGIPLAPPAQE